MCLRVRRLPSTWICAIALFLVAVSAHADLTVLVKRPAAVRGAPLLLPVRVEDSRTTSPEVVLESASGAKLGVAQSQLLWPVHVTSVTTGRWAAAANSIEIQAQRPPNASDAYLVIELPSDIASDARLVVMSAGQRTEVHPYWHDRAAAELLPRLARRAAALVGQGAPDELLSRPDPQMPLERFRYAIGCALRSWEEPPAFDRGSPADLASRAVTELWLAALARIASKSDGVAAEVAELLVATCGDATASAPIAAWLADPQEVGALLALALDPARSEDAMIEAVVSWLRVRSPLLLWIEEEGSREVIVAIANPTSGEEVVRLQWIAADDAPVAALMAPFEVARVPIVRPARASIDGAEIPSDAVDVLRLENRGQVRQFAVSPAAIPAGVAGVSLTAFSPPLDLPAVSATARMAVVPRTFASLRPRLNGWEIFVDARDVSALVAAVDGDSPGTVDEVEVVGPHGSIVTVNHNGEVQDPSASLDGSSGVAFHNYGDTYRFSFTLPPAWLEREETRTIVRLAFRRRVGRAVFDAPFASVPWRANARTIGIDILERK